MRATSKHLRDLARWQREHAHLSSGDERGDRLHLADYLDRRADALDAEDARKRDGGD